MSKKKFIKSIAIEISGLGVAIQNKFPYQQYLQDKYIVGISAVSSTKGPVSGGGNIMANIQQNAITSGGVFITLQDSKGFQFIQSLPILELAPTNYVDVTQAIGTNNRYSAVNVDGMYTFYPRKIVWENSFILDPNLVLGVGNVLAFQVFFIDEFPQPQIAKKSIDTFRDTVNFQLVALQVNAASGRFYFPDLPNLRGAIIQNIHSYFSNAVPFSDTKIPVLPYSTPAASNAFITFVKGGVELHKQINIAFLNVISYNQTYYNTGGTVLLDNIELTFDQCYVEYPQGFTQPVSYPYCFLFGVTYIKPEQIQK